MTTPWVIAFVVLWVIVLLTAVVTLGLLRRIGNLLEHAEARLDSRLLDGVAVGGIPVSSHVPDFHVVVGDGAGAGHVMTSDELIRASTILLFMDADCGPCKELANELSTDKGEIDGVQFHVVLDKEVGRPDWLPVDVPTVYERAHEVSKAFLNMATPQAYLLDADRVVAKKRVVHSLSDLQEMVRQQATMRG